MDRFLSDPLPLSPSVAAGRFNKAQLVFYGVDHSGPSFEARAFLDSPEAGPETPDELERGYAGHFTIFGHGGCFGDEGHCHVPDTYKDVFDKRPLHPLTPQTKKIEITAALKRLCADESADRSHLRVTVLPLVVGRDGPELGDVLFFSAMRFVAFD